MKANSWVKRIKKCCEEAGTYKPCFDDSINTLAMVLEVRDDAYKKYVEEGAVPIVEHTNKAGATNSVKNPYLMLIDEYSITALTYWRDLGLTPKGLRAIDESMMKEKKKDAFADVLKDIGY